jgi:hypothetical protein
MLALGIAVFVTEGPRELGRTALEFEAGSMCVAVVSFVLLFASGSMGY